MAQPSKNIVAVLFDADGVVQRTSSGWLEALGRLCAHPDEIEHFIDDVFAAEAPCLLGEGDFEASLSAVLRKWNSPSPVKEALQVWTMIEPDSGVFDLIQRLRSSNTRVALATNQQAHRANHMLNQLGYTDRFDHIFCSCFLGHAKPGIDFFETTVQLLNVPANRLLFIDDHERNVESAKNAGLNARTFHLDDGVEALTAILDDYGLSYR